ncbi:uncharacterized protein LOC143290133 isoform X2 [Babylonia areolata]
MPCEMCEEEDQKEAAYSCNKCQQSMCGTCRRLHDKIANPKEHQVRPLSPPRKASSRKETVKKCKVHQDHELCLFCTDCGVMICLVCKLTSHQPHETEDVGAAAVRGKEELSALVKRAREQVFVTNKLRSRLSRDVQELHRQRKEASEEVRARHDMVLAWVSRAQEELLEAISADSETALAQLEMEDTAASNAIETLSRLLARAAVSTTDSSETLLLKVELNAAVVAREKLEELKKESERAEQRRFLTVKSDSSAVDLGVVRAFLGELSVGHMGDAPSVSLRDQIQALEAKVEAMETSHRQLDTRAGGVESRVWDVDAPSVSLRDQIQALEAKMEAVETSHRQLDTSVGRVDSENYQLNTRVAKVERKHRQLDDRVDGVENEQSKLGKKVRSVDDQHSQLGIRVGDVETKHRSLETRVGDRGNQTFSAGYQVWWSGNQPVHNPGYLGYPRLPGP